MLNVQSITKFVIFESEKTKICICRNKWDLEATAFIRKEIISMLLQYEQKILSTDFIWLEVK